MIRYTIALAAVCLLAGATTLYAKSKQADKSGSAEEQAVDQADKPVLDHTMTTLDGKAVNLAEKYKGKVVLIVNTASKCGYTPQYAGLEKIYEKYKDQGLVILGFPCNQFGRQAPGDSEHIRQFCTQNYGVTFDMFAKLKVNGKEAAPLYQYLTSKKTPLKDQGRIKWNFEKFLIGRDGKLIARFRSKVEPTSEAMVQAIETQLKQKAEGDHRSTSSNHAT